MRMNTAIYNIYKNRLNYSIDLVFNTYNIDLVFNKSIYISILRKNKKVKIEIEKNHTLLYTFYIKSYIFCR